MPTLTCTDCDAIITPGRDTFAKYGHDVYCGACDASYLALENVWAEDDATLAEDLGNLADEHLESALSAFEASIDGWDSIG